MMNYTGTLRPFSVALFPKNYVLDPVDGDYGCLVRYVDARTDPYVFFGDEEDMIMLASSLAGRDDVSSTTPFVCS